MAKKIQHNKGKIKDNAIKALVRSNIFRHKIEKPKKGAGSFNRQKTKRLDNYSERFVFDFKCYSFKPLPSSFLFC